MNKEHLDLEEELILQQLRLEQEIIRGNILKNLNKSESILNGLLPENINFKLEYAESLGEGFVLPLKVRGIFLVEGKPKRRYYLGEDLKESISNPANKRFPIKQDHREDETSPIVGVVERLSYDPNIKLENGNIKPGLRFWGHINDETTARNILDGIIKDVSVTVYAGKESYDEKYGIIGKKLVYSELSTVVKGSVRGNYIEPDM